MIVHSVQYIIFNVCCSLLVCMTIATGPANYQSRADRVALRVPDTHLEPRFLFSLCHIPPPPVLISPVLSQSHGTSNQPLWFVKLA
ncbi:uncharacterized protein K460DRAFT_83037 [Cucurbitaria berberidis CBS 394.84]|uniref:Uncharacterized protein n=1 Tax=Cucurbitaria berberidis CBS 394.84 TaxID=1168544 RepID=A0A9P4GPB6_9PLEO|nr:uncharacterized protein K460DRAFT_83037 [Cucurbitaria berberidis CBS 394.84]KAF1848941.1 hypothetical protein K460DRAFT_83037 [Cucurbitaria berberidis CBS 394.84]